MRHRRNAGRLAAATTLAASGAFAALETAMPEIAAADTTVPVMVDGHELDVTLPDPSDCAYFPDGSILLNEQVTVKGVPGGASLLIGADAGGQTYGPNGPWHGGNFSPNSDGLVSNGGSAAGPSHTENILFEYFRSFSDAEPAAKFNISHTFNCGPQIGYARVIGRIMPNADMRIHVPQAAGGAADVKLNLTATDPLGPGFLTAYDCALPQPGTSDVNYDTGQTVANAATVRISKGDVCVHTSQPANIVADIAVVAPEGTFGLFAAPQRVLDTRGGLKLNPAADRCIKVAPEPGKPGEVTMNLTVTEPEGPGFLDVYPKELGGWPGTSRLNYAAGKNVPNEVVVPVGPSGEVCLHSYATTHAIVDLKGSAPSGTYGLFSRPVRYDFRGGPELTPDTDRCIVVAPGTGTVILNATVTEPKGPGFIAIYKKELGGWPGTSNVGFAAGENRANSVTAPVGPSGVLCVKTMIATFAVIDVGGFKADGIPGVLAQPERTDSRTGTDTK